MALFVLLVIAPVALFWQACLPPSPPPPPAGPAPPPHQEVMQQFTALREEHDQAMLKFQEELAAAGSKVAAAGPVAETAVLAEKYPGKKYFLRFIELAEKHPEHPICPIIVGHALHSAGPYMTHEDHLRIKSILERHHRLFKPGDRP
jgi:hypothetical protein